MIETFFDAIARGSTDPLTGLFSVTRRVYLPFLFGAALVGALVWFFKLRRRCSLLAFLFPARIWLHPSARLDYKLMFARSLLSALLLGPFVISVQAVALGTARVLGGVFGAGPWAAADASVVAVVFTLLAFLGDDFARYVVHRAAHQVPALWELHKVHHSAEVLTPFTVYRTHPVESIVMRGGAAIGVGVAAGITGWAFQGRVSGWEILGAHGLSVLWNLLGSNLRHSHVWVSYGRFLEHLLISPAQHQIHHSDQERHYHRNFGSALAIWDWIGGSLYVPRGRERLRFGLPPDVTNHGGSVLSVWLAPLAGALRALLPRRTSTFTLRRRMPRAPRRALLRPRSSRPA